MTIRTLKPFLFVAIAAALSATPFHSKPASAYVLQGATWPTNSATYFINPANLNVTDNAAEAAVQVGANAWYTQAGIPFKFVYGGRSTQTTTGLDYTNLVVFRNQANGSAIATTYSWFSGSTIVDADVVFWNGGFTFFTGTTGCLLGFYIEDIATHEFGHALGMAHSTDPTATMYPSTPYCNSRQRILSPDDIAGVRALYPPIVTTAPPSPPTGVRIIG